MQETVVTIAAVIIIIWFVCWVVERVPRVLGLLKLRKYRAYQAKCNVLQAQLGEKLTAAKERVERDWFLGGADIATAYVDGKINELPQQVPATARQQLKEQNLEHFREIYTGYLASLLIASDIATHDEQIIALWPEKFTEHIDVLRATREEFARTSREHLLSIGYDLDSLEARYTAPAAV